jgi:diguanylate cyclase (GGDEF)-like protein
LTAPSDRFAGPRESAGSSPLRPAARPPPRTPPGRGRWPLTGGDRLAYGVAGLVALTGAVSTFMPIDARQLSFALLAVAVPAIAIIKWRLDAEPRRLLTIIAQESRARADRIHAVWAMAAVKDRDPTERFTRMLERSCPAIRPRKPIRASLSHIDGDNVVCDAVFCTGPDAIAPHESPIVPGVMIPFSTSVQSLMIVDGDARAWNNIEGSELMALRFARGAGVKSMIASAVTIGRVQYFLTYACPETMEDEPFTEDDLHFIDIVAAQFASTARQFDYIDRLQHQMEHDALTGLENRVQFGKAIRREIAAGNAFAVGMMNLDRFRSINERHGHLVGDEVLVDIATELAAIDGANLVARLNGDEFGILLRDPPASGDRADLARNYLERFERPFNSGDREGPRALTVRASLGLAVFPEHGSTTEELVRCADVALEIAKERGAACAVVFDTTMESIVKQREFAIADLTRAVANDEFRLVYQPTFELKSRQICGAEALLRWDHPERGEVMPASFIPIAEQTDTIGLLSHWVLGRLVRDLEGAQLPRDFRCYFNLAAQDLIDFTFVRALTDAVEKYPRLVDQLGIEITETTAMQNVERSLNTIGIIRGLGVRVAIDDFGTGYSSLSYLKRLSVDLIKIDRAFVMGLPEDDRDAGLSEAMIDICQRFKTSSLAEGIETEAQLEWLVARGCRYGQGYLISKPIEFSELVSRVDLQRLPAT